MTDDILGLCLHMEHRKPHSTFSRVTGPKISNQKDSSSSHCIQGYQTLPIRLRIVGENASSANRTNDHGRKCRGNPQRSLQPHRKRHRNLPCRAHPRTPTNSSTTVKNTLGKVVK